MKTLYVEVTAKAQKQFKKAPHEILEVVLTWIKLIKKLGLRKVREQGGKGLHDEPLKGDLKGLRSVRLNRSWRLYYREVEGEEVTIVKIEKIDKHEYKGK